MAFLISLSEMLLGAFMGAGISKERSKRTPPMRLFAASSHGLSKATLIDICVFWATRVSRQMKWPTLVTD
jgi:hypothetical protein